MDNTKTQTTLDTKYRTERRQTKQTNKHYTETKNKSNTIK